MLLIIQIFFCLPFFIALIFICFLMQLLYYFVWNIFNVIHTLCCRLKTNKNERQPLKTITNLSTDNTQFSQLGNSTYSPKSRKRHAWQTEVNSQESKENLNQNGKRTRRKCANPQKSPGWFDPNFKGVTLWFNTKVNGEHSQLCITSFFRYFLILIFF